MEVVDGWRVFYDGGFGAVLPMTVDKPFGLMMENQVFDFSIRKSPTSRGVVITAVGEGCELLRQTTEE